MERVKVLLTGASGTIGKEVFKELMLRINKFDISLFLRASRKNKKMFKPYQDDVKIFWGSLQNYDDIEKAVAGQEIIIHIAAALPDISIKDPEFAKSTNIGGTEKIIKAMRKQIKPPKIIYPSSVAVYGDRLKDPIIRSSDPIDNEPEDVYTYTKVITERLIQDSGLDFCIFRVSYVVAIDMIRFRPIMFHMLLETPVEIIHAKDVGLALVNAIDSNEVWGRIFNLGGGKKCQIIFRENLNDMLEIMGFGRNFFPKEAFAKHSFHCGFYEEVETREIQQILNFQRYTLEDFYSEVKKWIGIKKFFVPVVKPFLRWYLLKKSEFYQKAKTDKKI